MITAAAEQSPQSTGGAYRWYVLALLVMIYTMNFVDRQIITILAPYLKADLDLTDAQIGLLYGTAFAMFYALFGIPLARLADGWSRVKTLAIGLSFWSIMTTLSGFAGNFVQLGMARLGVGIGEASASPAAISLLGDYFPKRMRGTVLAIYTTGVYVGIGASLIIGGYILDLWPGWFGLLGWQAAFIIVGLPGVLLGLLVFLTVREPVRGALDGDPHPGDAHPFRNVLTEAKMMFPPWSFTSIAQLGGGRDVQRRNLVFLAAAIVVSLLVDRVIENLLPVERQAVIATLGSFAITSNLVQWLAIGIGSYAAFSWFQSVRLRDPVTHALTLGGKSYRVLAICCGMLGIYTYATGAFVYVYGNRYLGLQPDDGLTLGLIAMTGGGLGTFLGGWIGDVAKARHPAGRMYFLIAAMLLFSAVTVGQFTTGSVRLFFILNFFSLLLLTVWSPIMIATAQDLVIPRLRGAGFAVQTLASSLIGLGLGPYMVGIISDITGDLRLAMLSLFLVMPPLIALLVYLARILPQCEATVRERARCAGEPG